MIRSARMSAAALVLMVLAFVVAGRDGSPSAIAHAATGTLLPQPQVIAADHSNKKLDSALVMELKYWSYQYGPTSSEACNPFTCAPGPGTRLTLHTGDVPPRGADYFNLPGDRVAVRLRTYGYPKDPQEYARLDDGGRRRYLDKPANLVWSKPGPTFRLRHGDRFNLKLINRFPPEDRPYEYDCHDDRAVDATGGIPRREDPPPNCFHGDNTTNIHYHGLRGSPERPQDWVFLELKPEGTPPPPADHAHNHNVVIGEYDSQLDPISPIQSPGTFWYHPHKHGASFLQVLNGMAGGFIVRGGLDDALEQRLPGLQEKLLLLQEIRPALSPAVTITGEFWVNGVWKPVIEMAAGEIQRWRFINAGQAGASHVKIHFAPPSVAMRQIAQDGVPFAPANYVRQPLDLSRPDGILRPALWDAEAESMAAESWGEPDSVDPDTRASFQMAPGNRLDLLVKAPDWDPKGRGRRDALGEEEHQDYVLFATRLLAAKEKKGASPPPPRREPVELLTVRVVRSRRGGATGGNLRDVSLPPLPEYLGDVHPEPAIRKGLTFSMDRGPLSNSPFIDDRKYDHDRVDQVVKLDRPEQWQFRNLSSENHPFHIHVNPFQVTAVNGRELPRPWVWFDTVALPIARADAPGALTIRHRFLQFTGRYVLHCHILGHNDRGMMQNVEAER